MNICIIIFIIIVAENTPFPEFIHDNIHAKLMVFHSFTSALLAWMD